MNPVVLLDEIDKVGADYRGDPAAALLEVLDPAQNHTFRDHYLEVDLDLSDVLFLATANVADTIPARCWTGWRSSRSTATPRTEKVAIARDHLLPRQLERAGARADDEVDRRRRGAAPDRRPSTPARPACGSWSGRWPRCCARSPYPTGSPATTRRSHVDADAPASTYLGRPRFTPESAERTAVPGVATGLAVTGAGGDVLFIEATAMDGDARPDPDRSARRRDEGVGADRAVLPALARASRHRPGGARPAVHLHVPAGAVPKDGPSAGVTMVTALASLATGRPVRSDVGDDRRGHAATAGCCRSAG